MQLLFAFFSVSLLLLLLFAGSIDGRKELGEYWKNVMKEQPMPEVIQDLVSANHQEDTNPNAENFFIDDLSQLSTVKLWIKNKRNEGREEVGENWKNVMKEQPLPEVIQDLVSANHQEDTNPNAENFFIDDLSQLSTVKLWIKNKRNEGREEVGENWKNVMKEQPLPEVIQDLVSANHQEDTNPNAENFFIDDLSQLSTVKLWIKNKRNEGREEVGENWKNVMKEQPLPEVIQDLVSANHQEDTNPNAENFFIDDLSQLSTVKLWIKNKRNEGRKEVGEYWKKMMKEEPMPEILQELLPNNHQEDANPNAKNFFIDYLSQLSSVDAWIKNKRKEGRKEVGEYWKKVKKEEPMPAEVIQDLVHNHAEAENNANANAKEEKPGFSNGESSHCDNEESSSPSEPKFGIKDNPIQKVTAN